MSEVCECGIPITTKKGIRYKDAKDEKQLRAHFDHQSKHQGKRHSDKIKALKAQLAAAEEKVRLYEAMEVALLLGTFNIKGEIVPFQQGRVKGKVFVGGAFDSDGQTFDTLSEAFAVLREQKEKGK